MWRWLVLILENQGVDRRKVARGKGVQEALLHLRLPRLHLVPRRLLLPRRPRLLPTLHPRRRRRRRLRLVRRRRLQNDPDFDIIINALFVPSFRFLSPKRVLFEEK